MAHSILSFLLKGPILMWKWSVPYRSANRRTDPIYAAVWNTPIDDDSVHAALCQFLGITGDREKNQLPTNEEGIRNLIRQHLSTSAVANDSASSQIPEKEDFCKDDSSASSQLSEKHEGSLTDQAATTQAAVLEDLPNLHSVPSQKQVTGDVEPAPTVNLPTGPEETWQEVPVELRNILAAMNARYIEEQLDLIVEENYHTKAGLKSILRSKAGINKVFRMWRHGFTAGVGKKEKYFVNFFWIPLLAFFACYPDIAAGFLHQRTYNLRSVGSKIASLCQLFSLTLFPYHSFWLLFNWSLERIIGAFVGNTIFALSAIIPKLGRLDDKNWFRLMVLGMSLTWQIGVQFSPAARDYIVRHINRRQMRHARDNQDHEQNSLIEADKAIQHQLISQKTFVESQSRAKHPQLRPQAEHYQWSDIPIKTRVERFIFYTRTYNLGRPSDHLVGLLKENLEGVVNTYEDYAIGARLKDVDKGHAEPRLPKLFLVFFDIAIFAYVCYSFFSQPFTFNTVVAYGSVCIIKQAISAFKKYQTVVASRRIFTNMVAFNLIGVFLVSTPVTADPGILESNANFAALLSAMVFATLFLAEPIAPAFLRAVEGLAWFWSEKVRRKKT